MTHHVASPVSGGAVPARNKAFRNPPRMRYSTLFATAIMLPALSLAGCASHSTNDYKVGSVNSTYKTKHPILIDEQEKVLDIPVPSSSYALTLPAASAIDGFTSGYTRGANGLITIMLPAGSPNESAARRLMPAIIEALTGAGVARRQIRSTTYFAGEHGSSAPVRLSYSAVTANVEGCGKWPEDLAAQGIENRNYHNFGCASQNNLAAQISNPADLISPRGMTSIDPERRVNAIQDYRDGNVTSSGTADTVF